MKTNIVLLRGNVAAPALQASRASVKQDLRIEKCRDAPVSRARSRAALIMIWRVHPTSGRLQCRWVLDRGSATVEGVSCANLARKAA